MTSRPAGAAALVAACLVALFMAAAATAAGDPGPGIAPRPTRGLDPAKRPLWLGPSPAPAALDCAGAPTVTLSVGLVQTLAGTTAGAASQNSGYSCAAWSESGPEVVYRLEVPQALRLRVELASEADLDLFLLSACDGATCLAAGNLQLSYELLPETLPAGEAFLVVDGYQGAEGAFELSLSCVEAGLAVAVCDPAAGVSIPVGCQGDVAGSVAGGANLVEYDADCGSQQVETGGEAWYAVTVPARQTVTAIVENTWFDAVLWLYGSCGPHAACLGWSDDGLAGERERLQYANLTTEDQTVYLAVDSFRPLDPADPDLEFHAQFTLQLSCGSNVPVESRSLGAIKGLYR